MRRRVGRSTVGAAMTVLVALAVAVAAYAAAGALDTSFSNDGKVKTDLGARGDFAAAVAVQTDGKIVVAGGSAYDTVDPKWALARYNPDGTLDTTFGGGDGRVTTNFTSHEDAIYGVAIQSDGKIVAAGDAGLRTGNSKFALARYEANGTLDPSFGGDGKVRTNFTTGDDPVSSLVLQPTSEEIVVAGGAAQNRANPKVAIARYLADGSLDPSFGGGDGKVTTDFSPAKDYANAVVLQTDGKIVAGGIAAVSGSRGSFELIRYNADGTLDNTFSGDGKLRTNFTARDDSVQGVVVRSDLDIVAGGIAGSGGSNAKFALAYYHPDGTLDPSFGGDGKVTTDITGAYDAAWDIVVQPDDKVVAGGEASGSRGRFAAARYLADGTLDPDFGGGDGKVTVNFTRRADFAIGLAAQPADGNLVLVGGSGWGGSNPKFAVARLLDE
jgi:uncharacterized delta-60 repeat protein